MGSSEADAPFDWEPTETALGRRVRSVPKEIGFELAGDDLDPTAAEVVDAEPDPCKRLRVMCDLWEEIDQELTEFMLPSHANVVHRQRVLTVGILRFALRIGWRFEDVVNAAQKGLIDPDVDPVLETTIERHFYELFFQEPEPVPCPEWIEALFPKLAGEHYDVMRYWIARNATSAIADRFASSGFAFLEQRAFSDPALATEILQRHRQMLLALVTFAKLTGVLT